MSTEYHVKLIQKRNTQTLTIPLPSDCPMDDARQQAYLTLMNTLLTCPNGEEGQIRLCRI